MLINLNGRKQYFTLNILKQYMATKKQVEETDAAIDTLEAIIDKHGMTDVMLMLVHICDEKAIYYELSDGPNDWQDQQLANDWYRVADKLISNSLSKALNALK